MIQYYGKKETINLSVPLLERLFSTGVFYYHVSLAETETLPVQIHPQILITLLHHQMINKTTCRSKATAK